MDCYTHVYMYISYSNTHPCITLSLPPFPTHTCTNSAEIRQNEWILIACVIIASSVFFIVPAVLVGILVSPYSGIIALPAPLFIGAMVAYVVWRLRARQAAKKNAALMSAAAQPVRPESLPRESMKKEGVAAQQQSSETAVASSHTEQTDEIMNESGAKNQCKRQNEIVHTV